MNIIAFAETISHTTLPMYEFLPFCHRGRKLLKSIRGNQAQESVVFIPSAGLRMCQNDGFAFICVENQWKSLNGLPHFYQSFTWRLKTLLGIGLLL